MHGHARSFNHCTDFDNSSVIDRGSFHIYLKKTLEACTLLLSNMPTIILSHSQTSIVFFLNSCIIYSFYSTLYSFVFLIIFILPSLTYILSFCIPFLSVKGCRSTAESSCSFINFLAS